MQADLPHQIIGDESPAAFPGFPPIDANFLYCPNQFFDLCLRHSSRGGVRLVAYLLRRTLGWLDRNGQPIEQQVSVTWKELISEAGISRGAIRSAIDDAIKARFIVCDRIGNPSAAGMRAASARYELHWDQNTKFARDRDTFRGFFAGEGHRTPIPNTFFDSIMRTEPLAVIKVVGAVLRHTVGYQNQFGGRRSEASLSFSYLQQYAGIRSRPALSRALEHALRTGYIRRVEAGVVAPSSAHRKPAVYAVKWLAQAVNDAGGSKRTPVREPQSRKDTSSGSETTPVKRFKKDTKDKTEKKDTDKQQTNRAAADISESLNLLIGAGFDEQIARQLASTTDMQAIQRQIDWLEKRQPRDNPLGMLRRAIEQDWPEPPASIKDRKWHQFAARERQQNVENELHEDQIAEAKRERRRGRRLLLPVWQGLSAGERDVIEQQAFNRLSSDFDRRRFRENEDYRLNLSLDEFRRHRSDTATVTHCS